MPVTYIFANATASIPLSELDTNFATPITIGNVSAQLGNTVPSIGNLTLANVTITSVSTPITAAQGGTGLTSVGTSGNVLTSNGTAWLSQTPASGVSLSANNTWTGTQTFNGTSSIFGTVLLNAAETTTVSATAATGTINFYVNSQSVLYYTSNASANWTLNVAFSSGTSLNTALSTGQTVTIAFLVTQGSTAYYENAFQIDGSSVTPKWQGGTAPTKGNASGIDVYTYTITKTASATYTVLASQTQFA
jgi:hypothetical protein